MARTCILKETNVTPGLYKQLLTNPCGQQVYVIVKYPTATSSGFPCIVYLMALVGACQLFLLLLVIRLVPFCNSDLRLRAISAVIRNTAQEKRASTAQWIIPFKCSEENSISISASKFCQG